MSEEQGQTPATTEETPAETTATTDDQPAVTEVTEVTPAEPEPEPKPKEAPKEEEAPKPKEEEVKEKPKPPPAKVVDYRTSKEGWVDKQGLIFKKWQRQLMSLDEEDSVLRWWKNDNKTSSDGALFMKYCADVSEPKEGGPTTTWMDNTEDRRFIVFSPYRAFFCIAESAEEKNDWIQRLTAAKEKYNTDGRKVVSTELISVEAVKAAFESGAADTDKTLKEEGIVKEEGKAEGGPPPAQDQPPAQGEPSAPAEVTVEVNVEPPKETPAEKPPKETPAEEPPKETPAEEPPKETPAEEPPKETPAEEPPKETPVEEPPKETPAEEPPKETSAEEPPKDETPAATEGGEAETKAED